ncbi:unnamed protein product, partial [Acidithrix sp. C25]
VGLELLKERLYPPALTISAPRCDAGARLGFVIDVKRR